MNDWTEADELNADLRLAKAIAEWKAMLAPPPPEDEMWEHISRRMAPPPSWLVVGTLANPIVASGGEFAWWSTVEELTRVGGGEKDV